VRQPPRAGEEHGAVRRLGAEGGSKAGNTRRGEAEPKGGEARATRGGAWEAGGEDADLKQHTSKTAGVKRYDFVRVLN
jgi:hypothetical protein